MLDRPGKLSQQQDGFKIVFERVLGHDIHSVWEAITDPRKMKYWFTDISMDSQAGGEIQIIFRDERKTKTKGEIIRIEKPHRFVWTWEGELAEWELRAEGKNKCRLIFTYSKLPEQYAVGAAGGFHALLQRLENAINGDKTMYPFGTEEHHPEQAELREEYGALVYDTFPFLQVHNPIKHQITYKAPVAKVWDALTKREQLKKWYFDFPDTFIAEKGSVFEWTAGPPGGKQWLHRGEVTEVVAGKKLVHTWEYPGYSGKAQVTWEIEPLPGDHTALNFSFAILVPFDAKEEGLKRKNFLSGWNDILNVGLKQFVER
jgi:uncharacterized protein YndB with AHSA1/START domain